MTQYTITSIKGTMHHTGTLCEAIEIAQAHDNEYQPAYGTQVEFDGETVWDSDSSEDQQMYETTIRRQRVGEVRHGRRLTGFNVYHAPDGCAEEYIGHAGTLREAQNMAGRRGLPESEYDTARTAGHCGGMLAPDKTGEGEVWEWCGRDGFTAIVPVFEDAE